MKKDKNRSDCPVSCFLDILGDKWSLLIIRDLLFSKKRTYGDFLKSPEGIATNILSARLVLLQKYGLIVKQKNPDNKKIPLYALTRKGKDLEPTLIEMYLWREKHFGVPSELKSLMQKLKRVRK